MNEENAPCKPMQALGEATMRLDKVYGGFAKRHGETYLSMWAIDELGITPRGLRKSSWPQRYTPPSKRQIPLLLRLKNEGLSTVRSARTTSAAEYICSPNKGASSTTSRTWSKIAARRLASKSWGKSASAA